jgi:putative endonuclease
MYLVYVIRSIKDGRFYVGITNDIKRRIKEHNSGKTKSTKGFIPWQVVLTESFPNRLEARKREVYFKGGSGKEYIKQYWSDSSTGYLPAGRQGASDW